MTRTFIVLPILALCTIVLPAASLQRRVERLLASSPAARQGFAGVFVVGENGRPIVSINAGRAFIPASTTKLFSTAFALEKLGPGKRFETRVEQRGPDLVLIGGGDANLSGRTLPYQFGSPAGDPLAAMDDLATQVSAQGIHEVRDVIGDDSAFLFEPFAPGWAAEDVSNSDGAPVGALLVNDDVITATIAPGLQDGSPVSLTLDPPVALWEVENRATTGPLDDLHTDRAPGKALWRVWGTLRVGSQAHVEEWAGADPAQFAAAAFRLSLEKRGVHVSGSTTVLHRWPGVPVLSTPAGETVARHESQPLVEDLRVIDKVSQNLHADLLLMDAGGSRGDGLKQLRAFLNAVGIAAGQYRFYDGSGLSRMNLATPEAVVSLLRYMVRSKHAEDWLSLLPVAGVDGSLAKRLNGPRVRGRIRAKTGSLNHVSALAGYAESRKHRQLAFAIFLNNALVDATAQHALIDKICEVLVD